MRSKWHSIMILHLKFDSAYRKIPGKPTRNKVLPCLIRLTLIFMFWPLTSRKEVKMTSNQKSSLGFGFSTPENPLIRIFSKCIRKLAPKFKKGFSKNMPWLGDTCFVHHAVKRDPSQACSIELKVFTIYCVEKDQIYIIFQFWYSSS